MEHKERSLGSNPTNRPRIQEITSIALEEFVRTGTLPGKELTHGPEERLWCFNEREVTAVFQNHIL